VQQRKQAPEGGVGCEPSGFWGEGWNSGNLGLCRSYRGLPSCCSDPCRDFIGVALSSSAHQRKEASRLAEHECEEGRCRRREAGTAGRE
jgi:hypothetical protein